MRRSATTRAAIGAARLPLGISVEIEGVAELHAEEDCGAA